MQLNANINGWLDLNLNLFKYLGVKRKMKLWHKFIWNIKNKVNIASGVKLLKKLL